MFHVSLLKLYKIRKSNENIKNNLLEEIIINDREEFEVKEILNKKNVKNKAWYLIKWK